MARSFIRQCVGGIARLLPPSAPEFIYSNILRGPLRTLFNLFVIALLPKTITIPEGEIVLNPADPIISGSLAFGVYEPYELELFRETVQPGMTVVDVGANIGLYSVIAAHRVDTGKVIAFEPEPQNYAFLQQTIQKNNFNNISTYQTAIADKEGELTLNLFDSNKGKHSLVKDSSDAKGFSNSIKVSATSLDFFLAKNNIPQVDVIKMDIEGAEALAIKGMSRALTQAKFIFMECTPTSIRKAGDDPSQMLRKIHSLGFELYKIDEPHKSLYSINNVEEFVNTIPAAHAANLLCKKTKYPQIQASYAKK